MTATRQIVLASRPSGWPTAENFRLEEVQLPALQPGQVLVRNTAMSVDPYMRGRMNDVKSYVPAFQLDQPLDGGAVGEVIESTADEIPVGTHVLHGLGWREHAVLDADKARPVDVSAVGDTPYLGVLGMPGLTAYAGLMAAAEFTSGDAVFVSGAAGAVGSLVGQIAKLSGASRVIGSAGSPEKVARLLELGFDAAFNYRDGDVVGQLAAAAPEGIDVYFDNVGGEHLEAAIGAFNDGGRAALCGVISQINDTERAEGPRNLSNIVTRGLTLTGFTVGNYAQHFPAFSGEMAGWLQNGDVVFDETVFEGIDHTLDAFLALMRGANTGKMVVKL